MTEFYSNDYRSLTNKNELPPINPEPIFTRFGFFYEDDSIVPTLFSLSPLNNKDTDRLHMYSKKFLVLNPNGTLRMLNAIGELKKLSTTTCNEITDKIEFISREVFHDARQVSVFEALAEFTKLILTGTIIPHPAQLNRNILSVQSFVDMNKLHGDDRNTVYSFISSCSDLHGISKEDARIGVELEESPVVLFIPKDDCTLYVFKEDKVIILTLYDPCMPWNIGDPCSDEDEFDYLTIFEDSPEEISEEERNFLESAVLLQIPDTCTSSKLLTMLKGKSIELYTYDSTPEAEAVRFLGHLDVLRTAKAVDGRDCICFVRHDD